jgi:hypothetical protein
MKMNKSMDKSIQETLSCYRICTETATHCLEMGGEHATPEHIAVLMDCAKICITAADFMIRQSESHPEVCGLCADICDDCAESCEMFEDEFMKDCAKQCIECAKECRKMAE